MQWIEVRQGLFRHRALHESSSCDVTIGKQPSGNFSVGERFFLAPTELTFQDFFCRGLVAVQASPFIHRRYASMSSGFSSNILSRAFARNLYTAQSNWQMILEWRRRTSRIYLKKKRENLSTRDFSAWTRLLALELQNASNRVSSFLRITRFSSALDGLELSIIH
jgi:hypothetical protein